jgi:uncharacterized protein with PIN domain
MKTARFQFSTALQPLLRRSLRQQELTLRFRGPQSVKHLVESLGIPHTEIGALHANSQAIGTNYLVEDGDLIEVQSADLVKGHSEEPRFVLDGHLGRLASHLRMLGFDCLYRNTFEDKELVRISVEGERVLLTRDRMLLMHKIITRGYLLRSLDSTEQLHEVVGRFELTRWIKPFQRCMRCNHPLEAVDKQSVLEKLEPLTKKYYHEFKRCPTCDQVYWKGSHYERMLALIKQVSPTT